MLDLAALVGRVLLGPVFMGQTPILLMQQGRKTGGHTLRPALRWRRPCK